jgi:CRISPR/Cas system CMR-associated protein Cmr1 (group 7 of RAMP superfamily)
VRPARRKHEDKPKQARQTTTEAKHNEHTSKILEKVFSYPKEIGKLKRRDGIGVDNHGRSFIEIQFGAKGKQLSTFGQQLNCIDSSLVNNFHGVVNHHGREKSGQAENFGVIHFVRVSEEALTKKKREKKVEMKERRKSNEENKGTSVSKNKTLMPFFVIGLSNIHKPRVLGSTS